MQLQAQQEVVELRHKGPVGEDAAESIGEPRPWDHHCSVQDVGITFGDFGQEWLIFCRGEGGRKAVTRAGVPGWPRRSLHGYPAPRGQHCKCGSHLLCLVVKALALET